MLHFTRFHTSLSDQLSPTRQKWSLLLIIVVKALNCGVCFMLFDFLPLYFCLHVGIEKCFGGEYNSQPKTTLIVSKRCGWTHITGHLLQTIPGSSWVYCHCFLFKFQCCVLSDWWFFSHYFSLSSLNFLPPPLFLLLSLSSPFLVHFLILCLSLYTCLLLWSHLLCLFSFLSSVLLSPLLFATPLCT